MVRAEEIVGPEWADWYRLSPVERWLESEKLWQTCQESFRSRKAFAHGLGGANWR